MAQRRQRAADHLFPCRLPPPSCFSKRWCFFHNCPQCSNQDRPLLVPSTTLGYRQVMSAKLNFMRYLTWWRLKNYYWLQYAWKTDTVMENLQPLDWINSFLTLTKLAPNSFWGLPHKFSTKNRKFINAYSGKSVNYTYMPTRMIEETFFLSCYMCGCSKFGAKIFVALKFELPKTQVVQ